MEEEKTNELTLVEKLKMKAKEIGQKAVDIGEETGKFLESHAHLIIPAIMGGVTIIGGIISGIATIPAREREGCRIEDEVTGLDFITKHPLNNSEILELGERMSSGMTNGEALEEMNLLKKEKKRKYK